MRREESRAEAYLNSLNLGDVVFEPRGNVTPDFLVGGRIAVEVRRLNQSYVHQGELRGIEEDSIPLSSRIEKTLHNFSEVDKTVECQSWFVCFTIRRRPLEPWKEIKSKLERLLTLFYTSDRSELKRIRITDSIEISFIPSAKRLATFFRLGGFGDFDAGGRVMSELEKNVAFCISAKADALTSLAEYGEKWLLLVDHIGYGVREKFIIDRSGWDRVILLAPQDNLFAYEPFYRERL